MSDFGPLRHGLLTIFNPNLFVRSLNPHSSSVNVMATHWGKGEGARTMCLTHFFCIWQILAKQKLTVDIFLRGQAFKFVSRVIPVGKESADLWRPLPSATMQLLWSRNCWNTDYIGNKRSTFLNSSAAQMAWFPEFSMMAKYIQKYPSMELFRGLHWPIATKYSGSTWN